MLLFESKIQTRTKTNLNQHDLVFQASEPHPTFGIIEYFKCLQPQRIYFTNFMIASGINGGRFICGSLNNENMEILYVFFANFC